MAKRLGLDEARAVVAAVLSAAAARNLRFAAAVVDSGGELVYFARMDGASPLNSPLTKSDFADSVRIGGQFGANRDDDGSGERSAR